MTNGEPWLCTPEEVAAMLKASPAPTPESLEQVVASASEAIMTYAKRQFVGGGDEERTFWGWTRELEGYRVITGDFHAVASVTDAGGTELDYALYPEVVEPGHPWQGITLALPPNGAILVDASWGWEAVPEDVHYAAIQQASSWYTLDSSRLSDSWADELGTSLSGTSRSPRSLLYGVKDTIRPYRFASLA